jgi:hypothetical protein
MRCRPQEHLLQVWAGILQQQEDDGLQDPPTSSQLWQSAEALWMACAAATLVSCSSSDQDILSRRVATCIVLPM